jgi:hypothetical protein
LLIIGSSNRYAYEGFKYRTFLLERVMKDCCEKRHAAWGLSEFRERFPRLRLTHLSDCGLQFQGSLNFRATKVGFEEIEDSYSLRGIIPGRFPAAGIKVFETAGRIAKDYHKMEDDSLCLGSHLRIRKEIREQPTLIGLMDRLIIPYLYNHSYQEQHGSLPVGELDHGIPGLVQDYEDLVDLKGRKQCIAAMVLLGTKKRIANKKPCPCGSGRRLGRCHNNSLNPFRKLAPRSYFLSLAIYLRKESSTKS